MRNTVCAGHLQPGMVVASGETVVKVTKLGKFSNVKALVELDKAGKHRVACWGWFSSIFMKK